MKIKLCGDGKLAHDYLTIGNTYEGFEIEPNMCRIKDDDGDYITVGLLSKECCGFLVDAEGNVYWEVVEE